MATNKKGYYGTARILDADDSRQITNLERTAGDESIQKGKGPAFDSPVSIRIHSYRCRLCDVDGVSGKALLDGLVHANVIADDSTKEVVEVLFKQTKVKNKSDEKVVVTVVRV
jgi:Holliday junction resolvase RusA-like endonuclease